MRRTKLSEFDMRVVINGLCQMRPKYCAEKRDAVDEIIVELMNLHDTMKVNKSRKFSFQPSMKHQIVLCLIDWRNEMLDIGKDAAAEQISETITLFLK